MQARITVSLTTLLAISALAGCSDKIAGGDADGARIFAQACARCHGAHGSPPDEMAMQYGVPDLSSPKVRQGLTVEFVRKRVVEGKQAMPGFGDVLTPAQLDAVAVYVTSGLGR